MRTMLTISIPVAKGNQAIADGSRARVMQDLMAAVNPEAAYFGTTNGQRGGFLVFELADPTRIPAIAEPLFQALEAELTFQPVMTPADLMAGLAAAGQA